MQTKEKRKEKIYVVSIIIICVLVLSVVAFWLITRKPSEPSPQTMTSQSLVMPTPKVIVKHITKKVDSKTIQDGLNDMGFLVTAEYYFTDVISYSSVKRLFDLFELGITETSYCASYDGTVNAGIDFSGITVEKDDDLKEINVKLPPASIFNVDIDTDSFKLISEESGLGNPVSVSDFNTSLVELEDKAEKRAIERGLLDKAAENAELMIRSFVGSLVDLSEYSVTIVAGENSEVK